MKKRFTLLMVLVLLLVSTMASAASANTDADMYTNNGGEYNIGYILGNFNVFVSGDYTGTHVVGPVVAGGTSNVSFGGISGTSGALYPHSVSSYFKGEMNNTSGFKTDNNIPIYVGSANQELAANFGERVTVTDEYLDFEACWQSLESQTQALGSGALSLNAAIDQVLTGDWSASTGDPNLRQFPYYIEKQGSDTVKITLAAGNTYSFDPAKVSSLDIIGDVVNNDTILYCDADGAITLPKAYLNGSDLGSVAEANDGLSLVYALPNATSVTSSNGTTGHIVAPKAAVTLGGGYFNGGVIARSLNANAEGHIYPYNGSKLPRSGDATGYLVISKLAYANGIIDTTSTGTFEVTVTIRYPADSQVVSEPRGYIVTSTSVSSAIKFTPNSAQAKTYTAVFSIHSRDRITVAAIPVGSNYTVTETDKGSYQYVVGEVSNAVLHVGENSVDLANTNDTYTINGTKTWIDLSWTDRPQATIHLLANGAEQGRLIPSIVGKAPQPGRLPTCPYLIRTISPFNTPSKRSWIPLLHKRKHTYLPSTALTSPTPIFSPVIKPLPSAAGKPGTIRTIRLESALTASQFM